MTNDLELLQNYVRNKSEDCFTLLVNRHLNLVYSAALRQVRCPQLANEIVQSTFVDLSRQAHGLAPDTILTAWLYQVTRRTAINVVRREARRQKRERVACELNSMNSTTNDWTPIEGLLDEAMNALNKTDQTVILLRFFENKSLREVGQTLGASDNAVQKRIARAVERLREFFARRGVAVGASGIVAAISVNGVQAAPLGLVATVSAASIISATTFTGTTTATITKAITMTTFQKASTLAICAVAAGTGFFEMRRASTVKAQIQALQKEQAPLVEQIQRLQKEREEATGQLTTLRADNKRLNGNTSELVRLRNEVALLRTIRTAREQTANAQLPQTGATNINDNSANEIGKALGMAVAQGAPGAFGKLSELAKVEHASFNSKNVGLNEIQSSELNRQTFAPLNIAFKVIQEAAVGGNQIAADAVAEALQISELKGSAVKCIGALAGNGNDAALEILLNPRKHDLLASGVVGALQPAADQGNQKAIDFLAAVAGDASQSALWHMAALGLEKSAGSGNAVAIEALITLSTGTNINSRNAVIPGLRAAAANQNAKAAEALRSMGIE